MPAVEASLSGASDNFGPCAARGEPGDAPELVGPPRYGARHHESETTMSAAAGTLLDANRDGAGGARCRHALAVPDGRCTATAGSS